MVCLLVGYCFVWFVLISFATGAWLLVICCCLLVFIWFLRVVLVFVYLFVLAVAFGLLLFALVGLFRRVSLLLLLFVIEICLIVLLL